jgi:enoyl-CoA hydratase/carnithine racemase
METVLPSDTMHLEKEGKRAWVTLTRESHLNAVDNDGTVQFQRIALAIREDPDIRIVVIRGRGRAFCTGIDLKELPADKIDMSYHERWEKALRTFDMMTFRKRTSVCRSKLSAARMPKRANGPIGKNANPTGSKGL